MKVLPEKYLLTYFRQMTNQVTAHYENWFTPEEKEFVDGLHNLSESALCLLLRMDQRKGIVFKSFNLRYSECENVELALRELEESNVISQMDWQHHDYFHDILALLTCAELRVLLRWCKIKVEPKQKKGELVWSVFHSIGLGQFLKWSAKQLPFVILEFGNRMKWLKFLFFGNLHDDLSRFVVLDVGNIELEKISGKAIVRRFPDRKAMDDAYSLELRYADYRVRSSLFDPMANYDWFSALSLTRDDLHPLAHGRFDRLCLRLGRTMEKQGLTAEALEIYGYSQEHPARERSVRLLLKAGHENEALDLCNQILRNPVNVPEGQFASDILGRIEGKRLKATTILLRSAHTIALDYGELGVETAVLRNFEENGYICLYTENHSWRALFGLLLWDVIHDTKGGGYHHSLQVGPADLRNSNFLAQRGRELERALHILAEGGRAIGHLQATFRCKYGIANGLFGWHPKMCVPLVLMLEYLPPLLIRDVLMELATNIGEKAKGFPDLMLCKEGKISFVEVKSKNDNLSSQQLFWLNFLIKRGGDASVLRVLPLGECVSAKVRQVGT